MGHVTVELSRPQLGVLQHVRRTVHRSGRYAGRLQQLAGPRRGARAGPGGHQLHQFASVGQPRLARRKAWIVGPFGVVENGCGKPPLVIGTDRDDAPFVIARARTDGVQAGVFADPGNAVGQCGLGDVKRVELVDHDLGLRDVDIGPAAGPVAMNERRQRRDGGDPAHHVIGEDRRRVVKAMPSRVGLAVGIVGRPEPGDTGGGADQRPVAHAGAPWSLLAERAAPGEHDPGVDGMQCVVGKPQCGKGSRLKVGEHRVGPGDQPAEDLLAFGTAKIQSQRQMVTVCPGERLTHRVADAGLPQAVGVVGAFDFDDLGAQITE